MNKLTFGGSITSTYDYSTNNLILIISVAIKGTRYNEFMQYFSSFIYLVSHLIFGAIYQNLFLKFIISYFSLNPNKGLCRNVFSKMFLQNKKFGKLCAKQPLMHNKPVPVSRQVNNACIARTFTM